MYISELTKFLTALGVNETLSKVIAVSLNIFTIVLFCLLIYMIIKLISKIISIKAKTDTMKLLSKFSNSRYFPSKLSFLFIALFLSSVVYSSDFLSKHLQKLPLYVIIAAFIVLTDCVLNIICDFYSTRSISKKRPIKGLIQIIKIILYIIFAIIVISMMIGQSPLVLIGGIGTFTAIISIVFKDALLGLVAGVQITADDLLRIGDWVEIPSQSVEGTVQDISLISVKILAFDNTLYTIPAYTFLSVPFRNWHTAINGKARRSMKSVSVDAGSVALLDDNKIKALNKKFGTSIKSGSTNLTAYTEILKTKIREDEHVLKDKLVICQIGDAGNRGIPVEFFFFTDLTDWEAFSRITSDKYTLALLLLKETDLKIFQVSGSSI